MSWLSMNSIWGTLMRNCIVMNQSPCLRLWTIVHHTTYVTDSKENKPDMQWEKLTDYSWTDQKLNIKSVVSAIELQSCQWNSLDDNVKSAINLMSFKQQYFSIYQKWNKLYNSLLILIVSILWKLIMWNFVPIPKILDSLNFSYTVQCA